jgi:hypothetical protein
VNFKLAITGDLKKIIKAETDTAKRAIKDGLRDTAGDVKQALRDQVTGAGMGNRLAKTWRSSVYPKGGKTSFEAAAEVWSKAPVIVKAFDEGAVIRSSSGSWLAIPTDNAPKRGVGRKRINPSNFPEHRYGPLRFVYRKNGPSLLVVDGVRINKNGRVGRRLKNGGKTKKGQLKTGVSTVVMFVIVPQVRLPKRLNIAGARRRGEARLAKNILKHWRDGDGR